MKIEREKGNDQVTVKNDDGSLVGSFEIETCLELLTDREIEDEAEDRGLMPDLDCSNCARAERQLQEKEDTLDEIEDDWARAITALRHDNPKEALRLLERSATPYVRDQAKFKQSSKEGNDNGKSS